jgi:hypothetical protein
MHIPNFAQVRAVAVSNSVYVSHDLIYHIFIIS